ncbi:hypothetical protein [Eremococcus coleocola]|uniref:Uncharacterized protein n=1 Tax=Eremococcus coleocola ACS-139-V-Col8 TaxID=908337 RepID=E4KMF3_9LACT|nr:hypothetical protein [Eremococcus coleocola]EFR31869.1 hypothetical protein HMPREF9257_0251 [Eremococcus coleocola ACS-139-V-Col8]
MSNINNKSNHLRQVQKQLEEATREKERLEKEARMLKVKDKLQVIFDALTDSDKLTVWLEQNTKTDAKVLATFYEKSFDHVLEMASEELEQARLKRKETNARRRETKLRHEQHLEEYAKKKQEENSSDIEEDFPEQDYQQESNYR